MSVELLVRRTSVQPVGGVMLVLVPPSTTIVASRKSPFAVPAGFGMSTPLLLAGGVDVLVAEVGVPTWVGTGPGIVEPGSRASACTVLGLVQVAVGCDEGLLP